MTPPVDVLDLDGGPAVPHGAGGDGVKVSATEWGPRVRLACGFRTFARFRSWLADALPAGPRVTLYGSGDFHHVTLALLGQITGPFNLLVLDKHPDWMRGFPFLHCGTWLRHALRLPNLQRVFHCGGELDFDNAYRRLAPWADLTAGRVVVTPAARVFARGRWAGVPNRPLLTPSTAVADVVDGLLAPYRAELAAVPLYVSIDKDVLVAAEAAVNWDSGRLRLADAAAVVRAFVAAAGGRLAGADLLGDWSPVVLGTVLNRVCDRIDHPSPAHDPAAAAAVNVRANAALLAALRG